MTSLSNAVQLGGRVGRTVVPSLVLEFELPFIITSTRQANASALVIDPRVQLRLEPMLAKPIRPFSVIGVGAPMAFVSQGTT